MASMAEFRERLRGDTGFRDRVVEELLILIGTESGLLDSNGEFRDQAAQARVVAPTPVISGRPLHQFYGRDRKQLLASGLSEQEVAEIAVFLNLPDDQGDEPQPTTIPVSEDEEPKGQVHPGAALWIPPTPPAQDEPPAVVTPPPAPDAGTEDKSKTEGDEPQTGTDPVVDPKKTTTPRP